MKNEVKMRVERGSGRSAVDITAHEIIAGYEENQQMCSAGDTAVSKAEVWIICGLHKRCGEVKTGKYR